MNNKKCIIIHGCPSDIGNGINTETDKHWIPWTKDQLIALKIETEVPLMPSPWQADYKKFKTEFEKYEVNEDTILVGHSCGCAFLVRWLGETKRSILKLILVAPWKIPDKEDDLIKEFYTYDIDETIKERVEKIIIFTSDNEKDDGKESVKIFHTALGGEIINLKNHGHYCLKHMRTEEFPELLEAITD